MNRLANKTAIVTGGTRGIGEGIVRCFLKEGAKVIFIGRDREKGNNLEASLRSEGFEAIFYKMDVVDYESWEKVVAFAETKFGKLNILVNNAGISHALSVEDADMADWEQTIAVNQSAVFYGMQTCIRSMKKNGEMCSIVNISSVYAQVAGGDFFSYCATKAAVHNMTKSAALSCSEKNYKIRVNSIHPGLIITDMVSDEAKQMGITVEEMLEQYRSITPIGYFGEPSDIGWGAVYLASEESKFVTGAHLYIDGGTTAQ